MYVSLMMFKCSPFICVCMYDNAQENYNKIFSLYDAQVHDLIFGCVYICVCMCIEPKNK